MSMIDPALEIRHLFEVPEHRLAIASPIHHEFWQAVPDASVAAMAERLGQARSADALPLCRVALIEKRPVAVVNLVDNDDELHPEWSPWLAGLVVVPACRGQGVGSALVRTLLSDATRLQIRRLHFGTDGPGFYERLGAVVHMQPRPGFWFMRFEL